MTGVGEHIEFFTVTRDEEGSSVQKIFNGAHNYSGGLRSAASFYLRCGVDINQCRKYGPFSQLFFRAHLVNRGAASLFIDSAGLLTWSARAN